MPTASEFSVIIPVCDKWELTRNCLHSLRDHTPEHCFEVIVVDNASTDATASELQTLGEGLFGDRFTCLRFAENRNFGPACNAGANAAASDILFFLNNDTLLTPGWAEPLLAALRQNAALGAVGPLLLYPDDTVQHLGVTYAPQGLSHLYKGFPKDHPFVAKRREFQFLTAAALMVSRKLFLTCEGFHEAYRNGFEDADFCIQIGKRGKKLRCIPESVIYHLESQTPGRKADDAQNSAVFFERCGKDITIDAHLHALKDGLAFTVNDLLEVSWHLSPEEELRLARKADGEDLEGWLRLVLANPLWQKGREVLAICFEDEDDIEKAGLFRMEIANILPTIPHYRHLVHLASQSDNPYWATGVQEGLERMLAYLKNGPLALAKERHVRQRHRHGRDILLASAYARKLQEMGHALPVGENG